MIRVYCRNSVAYLAVNSIQGRVGNYVMSVMQPFSENIPTLSHLVGITPRGIVS